MPAANTQYRTGST